MPSSPLSAQSPPPSPSPSLLSPPAEGTPAFSGLVAYPTCITVVDGGSSYREGLTSCAGSIVSLISLPSCPPINPPLQAIVTEVDAHGHVQSLELAVLRAFDSTSPPIELVAEACPTPLKRSLGARTGLKDALPPSLLTSKDPSPLASDAPAPQPLPGTLRIKLQSFTPYAALFKVSPQTTAMYFRIQAKSSSNFSNAFLHPTHKNIRNRSLASDHLLCRSTFFRAAAITSRGRSWRSRP